jgi:hypothetical protein
MLSFLLLPFPSLTLNKTKAHLTPTSHIADTYLYPLTLLTLRFPTPWIISTFIKYSHSTWPPPILVIVLTMPLPPRRCPSLCPQRLLHTPTPSLALPCRRQSTPTPAAHQAVGVILAAHILRDRPTTLQVMLPTTMTPTEILELTWLTCSASEWIVPSIPFEWTKIWLDRLKSEFPPFSIITLKIEVSTNNGGGG